MTTCHHFKAMFLSAFTLLVITTIFFISPSQVFAQQTTTPNSSQSKQFTPRPRDFPVVIDYTPSPASKHHKKSSHQVTHDFQFVSESQLSQQQQQLEENNNNFQSTATTLNYPPESYWSQIRLDFNANLNSGKGGPVSYSKSKTKPDYSNERTRWSSLSFHALESIIGANNTNMFSYYDAFEDHYWNQYENNEPQYDKTIDWRSEPIWTFPTPVHVYNKVWPRPQHDVAYSRTIVRLNNILLFMSHKKWEDAMYLWDYQGEEMSVKYDLGYIKDTWKLSSYDIWEHCLGQHFYNRMVVRKAMMIGAEIAFLLNDDEFGMSLLGEALIITQDINKNFFDGTVINPTLSQCDNTSVKPGKHDLQVLLALLHGKIDAPRYSGLINISKVIHTDRCSGGSTLPPFPPSDCELLENILNSWTTAAGFELWISPRPYHFDGLFTLHLLEQYTPDTWPHIASVIKDNGYKIHPLGRFTDDQWAGPNGDSPINNPWSLSSFIMSYILTSTGQYLQQLPAGYSKGLFPDIIFKHNHFEFWAKIAQWTLDANYATGSAKVTLEKLRDIFSKTTQTQTLSRDQYNLVFKAMAKTLFDLADESMMIPGLFFGFGTSPNVTMNEQIDGKLGTPTGGSSMTPSLITAIIAQRQREIRAQAWGS